MFWDNERIAIEGKSWGAERKYCALRKILMEKRMNLDYIWEVGLSIGLD